MCGCCSDWIATPTEGISRGRENLAEKPCWGDTVVESVKVQQRNPTGVLGGLEPSSSSLPLNLELIDWTRLGD